jgi:hypothetical protein
MAESTTGLVTISWLAGRPVILENIIEVAKAQIARARR